MIEIKDEVGLARDPYSKAIVRTDLAALNAHRNKRALSKQAVITAAKVDKLEQQMEEMKNLLLVLISRTDNTGSN